VQSHFDSQKSLSFEFCKFAIYRVNKKDVIASQKFVPTDICTGALKVCALVPQKKKKN
jgi:hypothetical protein